jgi:hypothetical protein
MGNNRAVNRDHVIRALKAHEQELRAAGVVSVSLFGSTARGGSDPGDVDIAVRLGENWKLLSNIYPNCSAARWMWSKSRCARSASKKRSIGTALLPSEKPARRLEDIIENAQAILRYTAGMDEALPGTDQ